MALVLNDRVKETTTTTGTGTVNLAGAETGFETFVQGVGNSNTTYYAIVHTSANEFEVGLGTVTDASPDTLSRTTILSSTNSDSAVDFSAGTKNVFCTLPASKAVIEDASNNVALAGLLTVDTGTNGVPTIELKHSNASADNFRIMGGQTGVSNAGLSIYDIDAGATRVYVDTNGNAKFYQNALLETAGNYFQVAGTSSTFWAIGSTGGSNPPGTASTTLAFHHYDGSAWNNEVEFNSSGDITLDGATVGGVNVPANRDIVLNDGTWTGEKARKIQAHSGHIYYQSASHIFRNASGTNNFQIDGTNCIATGNITAYGSISDERLKENIEVIENPIEKIKELKGVTFNYKKDGSKSTGLIAQDLEKVLPEAVYTSKTIGDEINDEESEEHLAIRYGNTVGLLVEAIKEQQEQIETLTAKVKELEDK